MARQNSRVFRALLGSRYSYSLSFFNYFIIVFLQDRLHVSDEILSLRSVLDTSEDHLSTRDVLLGVLKVVKEGGLIPSDTLVDVSRRVSEARSLTSLAADQTVQIRSLLVSSTSLNSVALRALGLEDLGTFLNVSHFLLCGCTNKE